MRTVKAAEFKAKCLRLMDEVAATGETIVVTKHGKPISRLVSYRELPATLFGATAGSIEILGDILEPIDAAWEADR